MFNMRERSDMLSFETLRMHLFGFLRFGETGPDIMSSTLLVSNFDIWLVELSEITSSSMLAIRLIRRVASFIIGSVRHFFLPSLLRVLV